MSIELVNGRAGTAHVSGADVGRAYAGMCGSGNYCIGGEPTVSMSSANRLSLTSCDLMCDGMHLTLDGLDEWVVENGSQGMKRRDLCCIKYSRDDSTGVETAEVVTLKGDAASSDPADPDVPSGRRSAGASTAYVPVARVELDGLTPTPTLLLTRLSPLATVQSELATLSDNVDYVKGRAGKVSWGTFVQKVSGDHIDISPSKVGLASSTNCSGYTLLCQNGDMVAFNADFQTPRYYMTSTFNAWVMTFRSVTSGSLVSASGLIRVNWALFAP